MYIFCACKDRRGCKEVRKEKEGTHRPVFPVTPAATIRKLYAVRYTSTTQYMYSDHTVLRRTVR